MLCAAAALVAAAYVLFDVNYFIRVTVAVWICGLFEKKHCIKDTTTIYGLCTTQDVFILVSHMNNARYVRELDFARFHFYITTGTYAKIKAVDGRILQGAINIRYRRMIPIFSIYKIETKLIYWKENSIFLEHKFVTLRDGFVRAVVVSRQDIVNAETTSLVSDFADPNTEPECPDEIKHWLRSMEVTSSQLTNTV